MQPKSVHTTGDSAALLVKAADFGMMIEKLDRITETLTEMRDALPLKRRKFSRKTRRAHIGCIREWYEGKCPCCREIRIIDDDGQPLPVCNEEHAVNRHEISLDKTWLVCQDCNSRKTTGKLTHSDVEALFRAYQVTLRKHLSGKEHKGPVQMRMAHSERIRSFPESRIHKQRKVNSEH